MANALKVLRISCRLLVATVAAAGLGLAMSVLARSSQGWTFIPTGNMIAARIYDHTATLLCCGRYAGDVLFVGGDYQDTASAELYDPARGAFFRTGSMTSKRSGHTATLFTAGPQAGRVLITGGIVGGLSSNAELYDQATGRFFPTGKMNSLRSNHTATLFTSGLLAGQVLIVGGYRSSVHDVLSSAELYNPASGTFTATGEMSTPRVYHTATLLASGPLAGQVLIAGGQDSTSYLSTAELYNPATGAFTPTGEMGFSRSRHTATLFTSGPLAGQVLVAGGSSGGSTLLLVPTTLGAAELFNPSTRRFTETGGLNIPRAFHSATLLTNGPLGGEVLIVGGPDYITDAWFYRELYDPAKRTFTQTDRGIPVSTHTATSFTEGSLAGQILIAGGNHTCEIFKPF